MHVAVPQTFVPDSNATIPSSDGSVAAADSRIDGSTVGFATGDIVSLPAGAAVRLVAGTTVGLATGAVVKLTEDRAFRGRSVPMLSLHRPHSTGNC